MTLPNGSVIDITGATTLEDGTVAIPEAVETMFFGEFITPERHYSKDGFVTTYDYYASSVNSDGAMEFVKVSKNDPRATHMDVFLYDLHYVNEPMVEHRMVEMATDKVLEMSISTLDNEGYVIEQQQWPLGADEYSVCAYDRFGRETRVAHYNADGTLQKSGIVEYTYLVESDHDYRYATMLAYDVNGNKVRYDEYDANGNSVYAADYHESGMISSESFFVNGNLYLRKTYLDNGKYDYEKYNADGTRETLYTLPNSNYTLRKYNKDNQILREQSFQADGSSAGYVEYAYGVDGWDSIQRTHKLKAQVFINQDGSVQGRLSMTELYESATQRMSIDYNEDGSVFGKFVTDKTTNTTYRYDGERLDSIVTNDDEGRTLRSEGYRYHADGTLMYKEVYDYQNNRYTRYDASGNILETFLIRS